LFRFLGTGLLFKFLGIMIGSGSYLIFGCVKLKGYYLVASLLYVLLSFFSFDPSSSSS
jgi:hypothetical protein